MLCFFYSIIRCGSLDLTKEVSKCLAAFEMRCFRRILRIWWINYVSNNNVLERVGKETEILNTVKVRKLCYFGKIMRDDEYKVRKLITQGKFDGKRERGRSYQRGYKI